MRTPLPAGRPPSRRGASRPALLAALLLAALAGGTLIYFVVSRTPVPPPERPEPGPAAAEAALPEAPPPRAATSEGAAPPAPPAPEGVAAGATGEAATGAAATPPSPPAALRITGAVTSAGGEALEGALLRWLPLEPGDVEAWRHDGIALGEEAPAELVPPGKLREALAASRTARAGPEGRYELEVPGRGVVVAAAEGHEVGLEKVPERGEAAPQGGGGEGARRDEGAPPGAEEAPRPPGEEVPPAEPGPQEAVRVDFALKPAGAISGKVSDRETGLPARGMRVAAGPFAGGQPALLAFSSRETARALVAPDGVYRLQGLPPGEYRVAPRSGESDYVSLPLRKGKRVVLEAGTEVAGVDFQVITGGTISGRVLRPGGEGLEGASCSVLPADLMRASMAGDVVDLGEKSARSGAGGRFELRGLPVGEALRVMVDHEGFAPSGSGPIELRAEERHVEVEIELAKGRSISGQVVTPGGVAAPGVEVHIVPDLGALTSGDLGAARAMQSSATSGADGAFTLGGLPTGKYELRAGKLGPEDFFVPGRRAKGVTVTITAGEDVTGVTLVHEAPSAEAVTLAGTVMDDLGRPLAGAEVVVSSPGWTAFSARASGSEATTGPDGRFALEVPAGKPLRFEASAKGHESATLAAVDPAGPEPTLVLTRHATIEGRLVAPGGGPPGPGGKVHVEKAADGEGTAGVGTLIRISRGRWGDEAEAARDDGTFTVEAPAGKVEVLASVPGYAPARSETLALAPGQELRGVEIQLAAGAVLHGRVTAGGASGVEGATVTVRPEGKEGGDVLAEWMPQLFANQRNMSVTDENGDYELPHLAPGTYRVQAAHPDFAPSEAVTVTVAEDQVRKVRPLVLRQGGVVEGRVREGEEARSGWMVQLMGPSAMKQGMTDGEGRFRFDGLEPGEYLINAIDIAGMQQGKPQMRARTVVVQTGAVSELDIVLGTGYRVFGKIEGLPAQAMTPVTLRRPGGPAPEEVSPLDRQAAIDSGKHLGGMAFVGPDGRYEISGVEPGKYILEVPRTPADPSDVEAYEKMDRTPLVRHEVTVREGDLEVNLKAK